MAEFDKEMWQDFVVEVQENLEEFEPNLLLLEQQPDDLSILNDCFRNMHSIKGAANYMGFSKMAELAHKIENLMDMARQGEAPLDQSAFDVIFKAVDWFRNLLDDIEKNHKETLDTSELIKEIDSLGSSAKKESSSGSSRVQETSSETESEEDQELITIFQEEMKSLFKQLASLINNSTDVSIESVRSILEDMERVTNYMGHEDLLSGIKGVSADFCQETERELDKDDAVAIIERLREVLKDHVDLDLRDGVVTSLSSVDFEEDQELYEIFLDFFQEVGFPLSHIPEKFQQEWALQCQDSIEKLKTSANYMDYMEVVRVLEEWEERLTELLSSSDNYDPAVFKSLWEQLTAILPGLLESFSQEAQKEIGSNGVATQDLKDGAAPVLDPGDLDVLDSAIDSLMEGEPEHTHVGESSCQAADLIRRFEDDQGVVKADAFLINPDEVKQGSREVTAPKSVSSGKTVRVNLEKVEHLLEDVAELVVLRSTMAQDKALLESLYSKCADERMLPTEQLRLLKEILLGFSEKVSALERIVNQLQDGVMRIRMLPVSHLFNRFPRMVRDIAKKLHKDVELVISGADTALDKQIMEQLVDPLQHIIRNAVDHGIESPEERKRIGKPPKGRLAIAASQEGNFVVISVSDDGKGLDRDEIVKKASGLGLISPEKITSLNENQIYQLIFAPGFSTAGEVSDLSGRGVGLDVVKKNVERAGGSVVVRSVKGHGTTILLRIPLTLAIVRGLIVKVGHQPMVIPVSSVFETFRINSKEISRVEGYEIISRRQETLPLIRLASIFRGTGAERDKEKFFAVRVKAGDIEACLGVDALIGQQEVVIKPLSDYLMDQPGFAGATILGDGSIALILDLNAVLEKSKGFIFKRQQLLEQQALGADFGTGQILH